MEVVLQGKVRYVFRTMLDEVSVIRETKKSRVTLEKIIPQEVP